VQSAKKLKLETKFAHSLAFAVRKTKGHNTIHVAVTRPWRNLERYRNRSTAAAAHHKTLTPSHAPQPRSTTSRSSTMAPPSSPVGKKGADGDVTLTGVAVVMKDGGKDEKDVEAGLLSVEEQKIAAKAAEAPKPDGEDIDGSKDREETGTAERNMVGL
jgi:hypothetical protein